MTDTYAVRSVGPAVALLRWTPLVLFLAFIAFMLLCSDPAHAASTAGGGLEWETPLKKFADSLKGPVAFSISIIGLVVCGATLVYGGEINEFARRVVMLIMVISLLAFASTLLTNLFGVGAVVAAAGTGAG